MTTDEVERAVMVEFALLIDRLRLVGLPDPMIMGAGLGQLLRITRDAFGTLETERMVLAALRRVDSQDAPEREDLAAMPARGTA